MRKFLCYSAISLTLFLAIDLVVLKCPRFYREVHRFEDGTVLYYSGPEKDLKKFDIKGKDKRRVSIQLGNIFIEGPSRTPCLNPNHEHRRRPSG